MADTAAFARLQVDPENRSSWVTASTCEVEMAPYAHDLAHVTLMGVQDIDVATWVTGTPVHLQWGRSPNQVTDFYGYLVSTTRHWSQGDRSALSSRFMDVWCIGASMWMRNGYTGSFGNQTGASIAESLANEFRLSIDSTPTTFAWPAKNAAGVSAWSFLAELAKADGRILACNGTTLRYTSPTALLDRGVSSVPTFYEKDSGVGQTVLSMETENTQMSAVAGRRRLNRVLRTIDPRTGQVIVASDSGPAQALSGAPVAALLTEYPIDMTASSPAAAEARLQGEGVANRFPIRATALLAGDTRVVQESPVVLEGLGSRDSGIWQVLTVKHRIAKAHYSLECELGRDTLSDSGARPSVPPGIVPLGGGAPGSRLVNGVWQTAPLGVAA
jgi:hypothetical protein